MNKLFKKLNYKEQDTIFILNAPESFALEENDMRNYCQVKNKVLAKDKVLFAIAFCVTEKEVEKWINKIGPKLEGDAVLWMCYPKKSSKKYTSEINRDHGWDACGQFELEAVRLVAIDEDWSALRLRKMEYIKTFKRTFDALSSAGKKKVVKNKSKING